MAARATAGAPKKPRKKAKRGARGAVDLRNLPSEEQVRGYFDRIHQLTDGMEEYNGGIRSDIGEVYEEAAEALDIPKEVLTFMFKRERGDRKADKKVRKMGTREKDAFVKLSAMFGEDSPLGKFAAEKAALIEVAS